ncbi:hypothetical protein A2819_00125 [Candidatus Azambacteria bacterium RIFCSPHIGHO2_01_FULL_40_24]|uniref:Uncharacterized protein n=1 Tax=Candidatus Azambacteria bacterium RIFCSPHIGHO2_01_FULL_40_24 TaxID=1797301 RepID=A0A1F5B3G1_9BACT|nr:MAG: hypothetical protein A2819_00125 [Candidatus Azambacteria bacterium RIFCSPHIGHO2_01_FULL_40_24]
MNYLMTTNYNHNNFNKSPRPTTLKGIPFAWQDKRVMKVIRESFNRRKRPIAIALYQTLTEQASNAGGKQGKAVSEFSAYLEGLAEKIGRSVATVKRYMADFKRLGIVSWQNRKWGHRNLANLYTLRHYSHHNSGPTSVHNNELSTVAHNSELPIKERRKDSTIINKDVDNSGITKGFNSLKDILDKRNA